LDFGTCPLFLFLSLLWVLSFYKVLQGSSNTQFLRLRFVCSTNECIPQLSFLLL
jgi:hypothetical protein